MADQASGRVAEGPPSEIKLEGDGLFHLPLCSRDIAVSRHDRIAVVWFHTGSGDQRVGVPIPVEGLRELALATVDALAKSASDGASAPPPSE